MRHGKHDSAHCAESFMFTSAHTTRSIFFTASMRSRRPDSQESTFPLWIHSTCKSMSSLPNFLFATISGRYMPQMRGPGMPAMNAFVL